jgi:3-hydroxybutyryl-CoA dehydrogenase
MVKEIRMVERIAVIGAGTMGGGIAQVSASAGHPVVVIDRDAQALERGAKALRDSLDTLVKRSRIAQERADSIFSMIAWSADITDTASCDLIVEAVVERLDIKRQLFADIANLVGADAILASNTSSLSITAMADGLPHPERLVGLHFFNPVPAMKLVEVIAGAETDPAIIERMTALMQSWGKHAVTARDMPGFIVNRVARPYYAEAFLALDDGIAPEVIDTALTGSGGFRMGPLTLADMIGHDVNYAAASSAFDGLQPNTRFRPQPSQARLVEQGLMGRKSGRGVYDYAAESVRQPVTASGPANEIAIGPDARSFAWLSEAASCSSDDRLPSGTIAVDGKIMAQGDGRPLRERPGIDILLDFARDHASSPVLIVSARDEVAAAAVNRLASMLDKRPLFVPDRPGQIVLRTLAQLANGAADAVEDGLAPASSIDDAMIFGANYPQGPIAWARDYGLAEVSLVLANIAAATGDPLYVPSRGLDRL